MMRSKRNVMALIGYANLGARAGRSSTDSTGAVFFLNRLILISLPLQCESQRGLPDRNPSKRRASP